jgi:hypothetical protein
MDFWALTDDEIRHGLALMLDRELAGSNPVDSLMMFLYDRDLQQMAHWLAECGWDRTLMRLRYADELEEIQQRKQALWFAPAGMRPGTLTITIAGGGRSLVDIESR